MKIYYADHFSVPLPPGHPFPIEKYALLRKKIARRKTVSAENLLVPPAATVEQLTRAHTTAYVNRVINGELTRKEQRRIGFPWSKGMVERSRRTVGATIQACRSARRDGIAVNLAGGTHHAFSDRGEGFCVLNDCAVAARAMQAEGLAGRILILDCDAHQGNGTADIFQDDASVFTFSIHSRKGFPYQKVHSDMDIALDDGTTDREYLEKLDSGLGKVLTRLDADLAIYLAGSDPYHDDRFGRLGLTRTGLAERNRMIFRFCRQAGLPVAVTMAGGYARCVADTVEIQFETIEAACRFHAKVNAPPFSTVSGTKKHSAAAS